MRGVEGAAAQNLFAGCLLLEVLGSMCGIEGAAAQNLVREVLIE